MIGKPPKRFVSGVVVLSARDAHLLGQLIDLGALLRSYGGSSENIIGSLLALRHAAQEWTAYANARNQAAPSQAPQSLDMSTNQAAVKLGVSPTRVRQLIDSGKLKSTQKDGRHRITAVDFEAYQATRRTA